MASSAPPASLVDNGEELFDSDELPRDFAHFRGIGQDDSVLSVNFGNFTGASAGLEIFLEKNGLVISKYDVESPHLLRKVCLIFPVPCAVIFTHSKFSRRSVDVVDGAMRPKVSANSGTGLVESAQIGTLDDQILYGTLETVAKLTPVEGVCFGAFTYTDDEHEVDIEVLSSCYTTGYGEIVPPGLQFTNQKLPGSMVKSNSVAPYGFDPSADYHTYTIEWAADSTKFYVDDVLKHTFTENIPTVATQFLWNAWSSGDPNWTASPPTQDSYTLIKSVHLQYTTA
ncbi:hypothetical protein JCM11641_005251 [Rhodosporidiobolus odoratus]